MAVVPWYGLSKIPNLYNLTNKRQLGCNWVLQKNVKKYEMETAFNVPRQIMREKISEVHGYPIRNGKIRFILFWGNGS